jgi:hypothetical protein
MPPRFRLPPFTRLATALALAGSVGLGFSKAEIPVALAVPPVVVLESSAPPREADEVFLDDLQRRSFRFFIEQAHPLTGMIADRARADGTAPLTPNAPETLPVASVASVGFGLTALCIGEQRGWISREAAYAQTERTLRFLWERAAHERGFFYHFIDMATGRRVWQCEASSIDTALLLGGVLTAREHFPKTPAAELATRIYDRVEWPWMLDGHKTLSMGYTPERGFIQARWDHYSEHLVMQLLGLGSNTHPLPAEAWHAWRRGPVYEHAGGHYMSYPPLFVHQFSHAWIDFRGQRDDYADYWTNSVIATEAHRAMCMALTSRFPLFGADVWGITSSDSAHGYIEWGGPAPSSNLDGTIVPCAAAGSIPFAPEHSVRALGHMKSAFGAQIWTHYGFVDAFNPHTRWVSRDVIGIDVGITLVMIENQRSGLAWQRFMASPEIQRAMQRANFRPIAGEKVTLTAIYFDPPSPPPMAMKDDPARLRGPAPLRRPGGPSGRVPLQ